MATATAPTTDQQYAFRNNTQGWLNVMKWDVLAAAYKSRPVRSGEIVSLTVQEQKLTAEMHEDPKNNPFVTRSIQWRDVKDPELIVREIDAPLLEHIADYEGASRPIGVTLGAADDREEGGTPDVPPVHR